MDGRIDAHVGADEDMVADGHICLIQHAEIEVGIEIAAQMDIRPIIAAKRGLDV